MGVLDSGVLGPEAILGLIEYPGSGGTEILTCCAFGGFNITSETALTSALLRVGEGEIFRVKGEANIPANQPAVPSPAP